MPKRLRQVAAFALERPDEFAFGTAAHLAGVAAVQASTLVRFAQTLGYAGFSDLQSVFRDHLRKTLPELPGPPEHPQRSEGHEAGPSALFEGFAHAATVSLERARESLDPDALARAVAVSGRGRRHLHSRRAAHVSRCGLLCLCVRQPRA